MEIHSPTINPTTQLNAACHTDSRRVYGETPNDILMYSQPFPCKIQILGTFGYTSVTQESKSHTKQKTQIWHWSRYHGHHKNTEKKTRKQTGKIIHTQSELK
jgi:hypothetical protein